MKSSLLTFLGCAALIQCGAAQSTWAHFEARHVHPLALTPDGTRLLALHSPDSRLCVYDIRNAGANPAPVLTDEIPVGLEPVSVRARTEDEVWVVNEVSDSISIVSLSRRCVVATLSVPDEPADVVFAGGRAFVSCARSNALRIFDAVTRAEILTLPLDGLYPRALAVNAAGTRVYAAFQLSGNGTTTLTASEAPAAPAPENASLPAAPKTALLVPASDPRVPYQVLDHDVAEISVAEMRVLEMHSGAGTNLLDVAVRPGTEEVWVANTEALNLTRFEPVLNGHFADHRLTRFTMPQGTADIFDLNPGIDYSTLPNAAAQATALAQPSALTFTADGATLWVAAFGSDRVARVNAADGTVSARVDVRLTGGTRDMRGPRGLVLHPTEPRLFVLNKLADSLTVIDTASDAVLTEVPLGTRDPLPVAIRQGRGFLFDARLSGNGTGSCAVCHLDADRDGMAWDLGNPGGDMLALIGYNNSIHDPNPKVRSLHPMRGPMVTQTLRGFTAGQTFHWRGDRASLADFNATYRDLMGGALQPDAAIADLNAYLFSLRHHPNPHRLLDRTLPATLEGGNPTAGHALFTSHNDSHCITCHALPTGSDNNIDLMAEVGSTQPVKTAPLRTVYQRAHFSRAPGTANVSGFGLLKDGTGYNLPIAHFYVLENFTTLQQYTDVKAYVLAFDTGTAPAVGHGLTVQVASRGDAALLAELDILKRQAATACSLTASGSLGGRVRQWLYDVAADAWVTPDAAAPTLTTAALLDSLTGEDALTFAAFLPGQGARLTLDRDGDTVPDGPPAAPPLSAVATPEGVQLAWPDTAPDWVLESADDPAAAAWQTVTALRTTEAGAFRITESAAPGRRFYRLRRTW